jgi:2-polyprenyl-3-methyl-5-hydroxy-6-metoxy-1,4-benzoquinol methylase
MRAQELLKYLRDIRLASTRSPTWWQYDGQFRHLHASNPSNHWGVINVE